MNLEQIRMVTIIVLVVLAVIQILYWILLSLPIGRETRQRGEAIIMPTNPENLKSVPAAPNITSPSEVVGKMVVISGLPDTSIKEIALPSSVFGIGRFYDADREILVYMDERSISRRHAEFSGNLARNEYYLSDTQSSYGTMIRRDNKMEPLTPGKRERIYNGDIVQFGQEVTVRFILPGESRPANGSITRV